MTPDQLLEFVQKLAYDDEFREALTKDPQEVLGRYGMDVSAEQMPPEVQLPPKELLQQYLPQLTLGLQFRSPLLAFHVLVAFFLFVAFFASLGPGPTQPPSKPQGGKE